MIGDSNANTTPEIRLSLWRLSGRKQIVHDGGQVRLTCTNGIETRRVIWPTGLAEGDPVAFVISSGVNLREQWKVVSGFTESLKAVLPARRAARALPISRSNLVHMRMLQALDGSLAGAAQRDIAVALFGADAVKRRWHSDSELRAQVRHLIRKGRVLMQGQYRRLLQISSKGEGDRETSSKSP